jgi:hypothetical protein
MTLEPYWLGVTVWALGFFLHCYGAYWRYSYAAARAGAVLCWIGFAGTVYPLIQHLPLPPFEWPRTFDIRNPTPANIYTAIWIAWLTGFSVLILSWVRIVPGFIGWCGFTIGMAATVASWTDDRKIQASVAVAALVLVLFLLASKISGSKRATRPGDYQAELLRLCNGDTAVATRLIKYELKRNPDFSRQAAAMAAVTRLRHDRR